METITGTKAAAVFVFLATFVLALVFTGAGLSSGGNSDNAKLCHGWQTLMDSSGSTFGNEGACVSYGAQGGAIYALSRLHVEPCDQQPFDGLCVSTSGFGLAPTTFVTTPLLKNGTPVTTEFLIVPASGTVNGSPFAHFEALCVSGNVYSATASGTSADSLSTPTQPGIAITSNTVTRMSSCP
jgi:hypothetical protein